MPNPYFITLTTPFGKDKLVLEHLSGRESLSAPFLYRIEANSHEGALDFSKIVGKNATVEIALKGGSSRRYVNGVVTRFVQGRTTTEATAYHFELRPWLWLLTQAADCAVYQKMSVPEIVKKVCSDLGFSDIKESLSGSYEKREFCVQYQETAFNFVSRLLEDEGIFYFFEHDSSSHKLVLADSPDAFPDCPGSTKLTYLPEHMEWTPGADVMSLELSLESVTGKYSVNDYNFETPSTDLMASVSGSAGKMRIFEYAPGYTEKGAGEKIAGKRLDALESRQKYLTGTANAAGLAAGSRFSVEKYWRSDVNASWAALDVSLNASPEGFRAEFLAIPADAKFRPSLASPKPRISGPQTAVVTGKSGEEIWTDKYGRIKVQFHWDQKGEKNENSSCWVRVAQPWAGKSWGAVFLPRVGQEVVVGFEGGDPDRPLVMGAVYNAEQTVPYGLPSEQTRSTIKSDSSKGGGGFNEICFEDKKDSEEIYVHAQKDVTVEIENSRTTMIKEADDTLTLEKGNRTETIKEGNDSLTLEKGNLSCEVRKGNETHSVKGTRVVTVEDKETRTNKADYEVTVDGDYTLAVEGNLTIKVSGNIDIRTDGNLREEAGQAVNIRSGTELACKAGTSLTDQAGTELTSKSGTNMTVQAGVNMDVKAAAQMNVKGAMFAVKGDGMGEVDGGGMLTVKGGMVKIN